MTNRRRFLQVLGFAPAAAPLAVKAATESVAAELAGLSSIVGGGAPLPGLGAPIAGQSPGAWKAKVLRFLAGNVLPDWIDDELRERNRYVGYLDPDIACKRAWSLNVKIATQRERNIARAKDNILSGTKRQMRVNEFQESNGVWI